MLPLGVLRDGIFLGGGGHTNDRNQLSRFFEVGLLEMARTFPLIGYSYGQVLQLHLLLPVD